MRPFRVNFHIAKRYSRGKIEAQIRNYPSRYPVPKYLRFCLLFARSGWEVRIHAVKVSKYVFVSRGDRLFKIRFSNHLPLYSRESGNDCDFYVGISHTQVSTTDQIITKITGSEF